MILLCKPTFLFGSLFAQQKLSNNSLVNENNSTDTGSTQTDGNILNTILGILCGLGSALFWSSVIIIVRKLNQAQVHYSVSVIYTSFFAIPTTLALTVVFLLKNDRLDMWKSVLLKSNGQWTLIWQVIYMLAGAVCGMFQIVLFNLALKYQDTPQIALIQPSDLVFGFVLQSLLLDINPDLFGYLGSSFIILGVFIVIFINFIKYLSKKKNKI